jgi:hypothetical protein
MRAVRQYGDRLIAVSRSAYPVVIRQTLNSTAYDQKQRTMPAATNIFTQRKQSFFKANSKVVAAQGFDINTMVAVVGFAPKAGDKSHAVEDLEQQEHGGEIGNRAFVPLAAARTSRSWNRMVKANLRLAQINEQMVDSRNVKMKRKYSTGKNKRQQWIKSAIYAGKGGLVLGTDRKKGSRLLLYINSVHRLKGNRSGRTKGDTVINATPVYQVKRGRKVMVHGRNFMEKASMASAETMQTTFNRLAADKIYKELKK